MIKLTLQLRLIEPISAINRIVLLRFRSIAIYRRFFWKSPKSSRFSRHGRVVWFKRREIIYRFRLYLLISCDEGITICSTIASVMCQEEEFEQFTNVMVSFDSLTHLEVFWHMKNSFEDLEKICFSYKKLLWVRISCNDYLWIFLCWMASYPKYWHQLMKENGLHLHFPAFLFQSSSIYTGKSQDITSTINKDHLK